MGIIEYRNLYVNSLGEEQIKINGRFYTSMLDRRIQFSVEQHVNKQIESIMRNMVDRNCISTIAARKLPILLGDFNNFSERADYQKSYGNLLEELNILSETSNIGFHIVTDMGTGIHYFEIYKGIDRSVNQNINSHVVFSRENDNLYEQEYTDNGNNHRTTAIVAGEGEGIDRTITQVNNSYTGRDRKEIYVDARDIQSEVDEVIIPESEYRDLLNQRGLEKLAEHKEIQTFEGKVISNNYTYKEDYDLGDIVTVMDKKWNVVVNSRITEVNEIYENGNVSIVPTLGNKIPTIIDKLKRM